MVSTRALASKVAAPPGRGEAPRVEATAPPRPSPSPETRLGGADADGSGGIQEYQMRRDERIRENLERMQRMGIVDLALKLRLSISGGSSASKRTYNKTKPSPDLTPRRSSRLQNITPVSYSEIDVASEDEASEEENKN